MIETEQKLFNVIDHPYIFNNMEKDPNTFYLVNTHIKSFDKEVMILYIGDRMVMPIIDIATDKIAGLIRSGGGYIKVRPNGTVKVLNADTADKLTTPIQIGDAEFDGSQSISLVDIGAIKQRRKKINLSSTNWTTSSGEINGSTYSFTYIIDITDDKITKDTDGDLMIDSSATNDQIKACINADINIVSVSDTTLVLSAVTKPPIDIPIELIYTTTE